MAPKSINFNIFNVTVLNFELLPLHESCSCTKYMSYLVVNNNQISFPDINQHFQYETHFLGIAILRIFQL